MLAKARGLEADLVFLDLEDSVAPESKAAARSLVGEALTEDHATRTLGVRVNPVDTAHCHRDLAETVGRAGARVDVVIVPKVDEPEHVAFVDHMLTGLERERGLPVGGVGLDIQVETAAALADVERIAACCPRRAEALVLGPGDLASDLGMDTVSIGGPLTDYPGDGWHAILVRLLVAARAHGLQAVDGPYARIDDEEGLLAASRRARALGYDGKWSIHPSQIGPLNDVFGVEQEALDHAAALVAAYDEASAAGLGAFRVGDEMVDEATRQMAARLVTRGRLAGMAPSLAE